MESQEYIHDRLQRLTRAVLFMRKWENHHEKYGGINALRNVQTWRKKVDQYLREEVKRDNSLQQEMF